MLPVQDSVPETVRRAQTSERRRPTRTRTIVAVAAVAVTATGGKRNEAAKTAARKVRATVPSPTSTRNERRQWRCRCRWIDRIGARVCVAAGRATPAGRSAGSDAAARGAPAPSTTYPTEQYAMRTQTVLALEHRRPA